MPSFWFPCGILPSASPGRTDCDADYHFYNPFNARFRTTYEALLALWGFDRRLPSGLPTVWDFSEAANDFVSSHADLFQLCANVSGWEAAEEEPS